MNNDMHPFPELMKNLAQPNPQNPQNPPKPDAAGASSDWVRTALIELKVRNKLLTHVKTSDALRIHVAIDGHTATLTGDVEQAANITLAETLARSVLGVKQVINRLHCTAGADPVAAAEPTVGAKLDAAMGQISRNVNDAVIETRVKSRLVTKTGMGAFKIGTAAVDGAVTLSGTVPDQYHLDEAIRITRETRGVREIHDRLKIEPRVSGD